jgi:hypothetical protein
MGSCEPIINGVPGGVVSTLSSSAMFGGWLTHDECEENQVTNATQIPGWLTVVAAGSALTGSVPALVATANARGQVRWSLTDDAVVLRAGWRRYQTTNSVAANNYVAQVPTWWWVRWRMQTAEPTAVADYYVSPAGIAAQTAGITEPTEGMGLVYDRTVPDWVIRFWRAGVPVDVPLGIPWNDGADEFQSVLVQHLGTIAHCWAGDPRTGTPMSLRGSSSAAQIQPAAAVTLYNAHLEMRTTGLGFSPAVDLDYVGWGGPGV